MNYEVELKFALPDTALVLARLRGLNASPGESIEQSDQYFNHPQRNFAETNEAFRIRRVGSSNCLTYKGPLVDTQTKSRPEVEIGFDDGADAAAQFADLLVTLSFRPVRTVNKRRTPYHLQWEGRDCEVVIDEVDGLGTYLEIEMLADEQERNAARDAILSLARQLQLSEPERKSYLRLLLERDQA